MDFFHYFRFINLMGECLCLNSAIDGKTNILENI